MKRATAVKQFDKYQLYISIHALVKRATSFEMTIPTHADISIHALVKRATLNAMKHTQNVLFQSTPS